MAQQYSGSWKQCATCVFWTGVRESDYFGQRVTVDSSMVLGRCAIPKGGWRNYQRQAGQTCSDWQKWPVLK